MNVLEENYVKYDEYVLKDILDSMKRKKEKCCTHCYYNKNGVCRNSCRIPIHKVDYCSKWFKED